VRGITELRAKMTVEAPVQRGINKEITIAIHSIRRAAITKT
jgi:hypothetical protein